MATEDGYIGSHMVLALLDAGHEDVVVLDDLSRGFDWAVPKGVKLVAGDAADQALVTQTIRQHKIDTFARFAAKIVLPEPVGTRSATTTPTLRGTTLCRRTTEPIRG